MSVEVSRLQGAELATTQSLLDKVKGGNYRLAVTGAEVADVAGLIGNKRITSFAVADSSANLKSGLDTLYALGSRLGSIEQSDAGASFTLSQAQLDTRSTVLSKIVGGYTVNLTGVSASKAAMNAKNVHVEHFDIVDTGRNIIANWTALRSLGANLATITKSDVGDLTLTATDYQAGDHDTLVDKFAAGTTFALTGASVAQAQALAAEAAVAKIDISDEGSVLVDNLASLETLAGGTKLRSIVNRTPSEALAMAASDLASAQAVLDLVRGGSYKLALTGVAAADAKDLVANNHKIATVEVNANAADIAANIDDLGSLGGKLAAVTQTDAGTTLALTGDDYTQNLAALSKIKGGYLAVLSAVSASKAATLAADTKVSSLAVSDTAARLSGSFGTLAQVGAKLTGVTQSDSANLQISVSDWNNGQALRAKFDTDPTVALTGARVSQVSDLSSDAAVQTISVTDNADALSAALVDLGADAKVTQLVVEDPAVAMRMTAQLYADSAVLLGKVKNGQYGVDLSATTAAQAAGYAADTHVVAMDIEDTSANLATNFGALASATNVTSVVLSDTGGTLTLTSAQIQAGADLLAKTNGDYQVAATEVAIADLATIQGFAEVTSLALSDSAANVSANFGDIQALGGMLSAIHLTDTTPILTLTEESWSASATLRGLIDGGYQADLTDAVAGDAQTLAADANVHSVAVADAAGNIAGNFDDLVALYNGGAGKLTGLSAIDNNPIILTEAQATAGADMLANLMPDAEILTY
jgi:hypothetical protein